jgi:L,D-transpeptidase ErfK/SrfK
MCRHRTTTTASVLTRLVAPLLLAAGMGGCASFSTPGPSSSHPAAPTDRFSLPPRGTDIVGELRVTRSSREDTLSDIARRHDLGYEEIVAANPGVDPWLPGEGTRIVLPTWFVLPPGPRKGLVLNLASMRLFYYPKPASGEPATVITHPIGIGREGWVTPSGKTKIAAKTEHPAWFVPASVRAEHAREGDPLPAVVPPGPDNPLGDYAMRLDIPNYLIHGTNKPYGVGMRVSHGCVRLYPEDIASLFPRVPVGTPVRIVNLPYLAGRRDGTLYLEAHPPLEEQARRWGDSLKPMQTVVRKADGKSGDVDWVRAARVAREARGFPVPISPGAPAAEWLVANASVVREPREPASGRATGGGRGDLWYVQIGTFRQRDNARRVTAILGHLGPSVPARTLPAEGHFRVVAGPYATKSAARADEKRIRDVLGTKTLILAPGEVRLE